MKTTIIRRQGSSGSLLAMDNKLRVELESLGSSALEILETQDRLLWQHASDSGFLDTITKGAVVLKHLGLYQMVELTDIEAHHCFITCCLLALRVENLSAKRRRILWQAILILAECCLVEMDSKLLPPFPQLPIKLKKSQMVAKIYWHILEQNVISLADALRLLQELERYPSVRLMLFITELQTVTEGLRQALKRTS